MIDVKEHTSAVRREVGTRTLEAGEARVVTIIRTYDAPVDDVWDACTNIDRIPRWFAPVTGDLRAGGRFQVQGNAGGLVERCDPPRSFAATWEFGGEVSGIEVRLDPEADGTLLTLEHVGHVDDEFWGRFGPGAVGVGWDLTLLGLGMHLRGESIGNPEEFEKSPEAREFTTASCVSWEAASIAGGIPEDEAKSMGANTLAFYVPPLEEGTS